jgi:predicted RNA binding protein YcfA (HicA-like mRNA interferase family)
MASSRKVFDAILRGQGVVAFRDLERLLGKMGFTLARVSGSHHIFVHPKVMRPVNIQRAGKDAKPYQIRQIRDIIVEFQLSLED